MHSERDLPASLFYKRVGMMGGLDNDFHMENFFDTEKDRVHVIPKAPKLTRIELYP